MRVLRNYHGTYNPPLHICILDHTNPILAKGSEYVLDFSQTIFIPWTARFSSSYTPVIYGGINGSPFTFPVNTGSVDLRASPASRKTHYRKGNPIRTRLRILRQKLMALYGPSDTVKYYIL